MPGAEVRLMALPPHLCPAPEVTILEPLQDMQLCEGQDAHFRCRLSRASGHEAHWSLGGVPLQANEMNDITVEQGVLHLLTLHKVRAQEQPALGEGRPRHGEAWGRGGPPSLLGPLH